jgi:hypothetical protein
MAMRRTRLSVGWVLVVSGLACAAGAYAQTTTQVELRGTLVLLEVTDDGSGGYRLEAVWGEGAEERRQFLVAPTGDLRPRWGVAVMWAAGSRLHVLDGGSTWDFVWDGERFRLRLQWGWDRVERWDRYDDPSDSWQVDPLHLGLDGMPMLPRSSWTEGGSRSGGRVVLGLDEAALARHREACERAGSSVCDDSRFENERGTRRIDRRVLMAGRAEVSRAQYEQCVAAGACTAIDESACEIYEGDGWGTGRLLPEPSRHPDAPRTCVTRREAQTYCEWTGGSLPWESEWAWMTGGADRIFAWGDEFLTEAVNWRGSRESPHLETPDARPLGANDVGLVHLSGNAAEWVLDAPAPYDLFDRDARSVFTGPEGVVRGGSFASEVAGLRPSDRTYQEAERRVDTTGFRCVLPRATLEDRTVAGRAATLERFTSPSCQAVTRRQREALRAHLGAGDDADRVEDAFFQCTPSSEGAWGFVLEGLRAPIRRDEEETEGDEDGHDYDYNSLHELTLVFSLTFCASSSECLAGGRYELFRTNYYGDQSFGSIEVGDLTGDGVPELFWQVSTFEEGEGIVVNHLTGVTADGIGDVVLPSHWLQTSALEAVRDVDGDGRADVVFSALTVPFHGALVAKWVTGLAFLAHQLEGGAFSVDDEVARAFAEGECGALEPPREAWEEGPWLLAGRVLCARLRGEDPVEPLRPLLAECDLCARSPFDEPCDDLFTLDKFITAPLPFEAPGGVSAGVLPLEALARDCPLRVIVRGGYHPFEALALARYRDWIVIGHAAGVVALEAVTGARVWSFPGVTCGSAVVAGERLWVGCSDYVLEVGPDSARPHLLEPLASRTTLRTGEEGTLGASTGGRHYVWDHDAGSFRSLEGHVWAAAAVAESRGPVTDAARGREWLLEGDRLVLVDGSTAHAFAEELGDEAPWSVWVGPVLDDDGSVWIARGWSVIHVFECPAGWCQARARWEDW